MNEIQHEVMNFTGEQVGNRDNWFHVLPTWGESKTEFPGHNLTPSSDAKLASIYITDTNANCIRKINYIHINIRFISQTWCYVNEAMSTHQNNICILIF